MCECGRVWNGKKVYETRDDPGKAVPLTATVRGRAEHGGQGLEEHFVAALALKLVVEDSMGEVPGRGAQRFHYKYGAVIAPGRFVTRL